MDIDTLAFAISHLGILWMVYLMLKSENKDNNHNKKKERK